jgi:hypothetical protein
MGKMERANSAWERVITGNADTIVAQDALMRRTLANMGAWDSRETASAVAYLQEKRKAFPGPTRDVPGLSPVMDRYVSTYLSGLKDYAGSREALMAFADVATIRTVSYGWLAGAFFKIARLSELYLDDPKTAGEYYKRVIVETPNAKQSFYALIKAVEHGAMTEAEVRALDLHGMTEKKMADLFPRDKEMSK